MPGSRFAARLKEQDFVSSKLDPLSWANASRLIGGCGTLIQLCKAHADSHRMLQVLLGTPLDTGLLLLVQSLPPETFHAVTEAPLHQGIVHFQAVKHETTKSRNITARLEKKSSKNDLNITTLETDCTAAFKDLRDLLCR